MLHLTLAGATMAALGAAPQIAPAPSVPLTFEAAFAAAERSPAARVIELDLERARAEAGQAGLWPNPELSVWREEAAGVGEAFAQVAIPLPVTGRLNLERRAAASGLEAAQARASHARRLLRARVREAFILLLAAQSRHEALVRGEAQLETLVAALGARVAAGESSGFDRMRAARELAFLRARLGSAAGERERERLTLAALLGLPAIGLEADANLASADPFLPSLEEARRLAVARPDLGVLALEATSADLRAEAARRRGLPEPTLALGAKRVSALREDDTGPIVGLSLTLPFARHGQASQRATAAEAAALRGELAQREAAAAGEAEGALLTVRATRAAETALREDVETAPLAQIATALYEAGEIRILELLDAYVSTVDAELTLIEASRTARLAEAELDRLLGRGVTP